MIDAAMPKTPQSVRHGGALKLHREATFGGVSIALADPEKPAKWRVPEDGPVLAVSNIPLGGPAISARCSRRGGARNRADRRSHALTAAQVRNLLAAAGHAEAIGLKFTRMVTIHWTGAGVAPEAISRATGRFTDLMKKAMARHGSRTAWIWAHEAGDRKGAHVHLLVHVPPDLVNVILARQKTWLRRISGQPYRARVICSRPIGGRLGVEVGSPDLHAVNLKAALAYVLKAANQEAASKFDLTRLEPGGCVIGKRCGASQNIGQKARKKWSEQRDQV